MSLAPTLDGGGKQRVAEPEGGGREGGDDVGVDSGVVAFPVTL